MNGGGEVLALDFDGVISDSILETFVVAVRTHGKLADPGGHSRAWDEIEKADLEAIRTHPLYQKFLELMPLGNRAEDFAVALAVIEAGVSVEDQLDFDRFGEGLGAEFLANFHASFYRERSAFRTADPVAWLALVAPFDEFVDLLRRRAGDRIFALATAKDRASIDLLLEAYGLADLFPDGLVVDKEAGRSKRAHLALLRERLDVAFEQITFVDDKLNHLEDVAPLGVRCVLSGWGYNGQRERQAAAERGFLVVDLTGAEAALFGNPGEY